MSERIVDCKGTTVVVGTRVLWDDSTPATVVGITEMDGDVDDYGRGVMIAPRVRVRFEDGTEDGTTCYDVTPHSWALSYPDGPDEWLFQCDDIEVDHNYDGHDWEVCPVCLSKAVEDGILADDRGPR